MREDHSRPVLTQPETLLHSRELLSEIIPCLVRRLARFKREQGQTETDDLEEHSMQRGLIRKPPREQRRPGLLLLDAESAKAVLKGPAQVPLDTYRVVHLPPPHAARFTPERRARKGEPWKITIPEHRSGKSIAEREPFHSRQKYAKGSSCMRRKATCWEESS